VLIHLCVKSKFVFHFTTHFSLYGVLHRVHLMMFPMLQICWSNQLMIKLVLEKERSWITVFSSYTKMIMGTSSKYPTKSCYNLVRIGGGLGMLLQLNVCNLHPHKFTKLVLYYITVTWVLIFSWKEGQTQP
jgi:hypothetical protein